MGPEPSNQTYPGSHAVHASHVADLIEMSRRPGACLGIVSMILCAGGASHAQGEARPGRLLALANPQAVTFG
ncbi:MAG: hypothetical protein QOD65_2084, partial [Gaiellales bacterium]|nr:hypothetical protein [Gaiellales bacterium]